MASHFSSIGLVIDSVDEMLQIADRASVDAEVVEVEGGSYLAWSAGDGPELWLQLDDEDALVGMTPHFAGRNRWRVALVHEIKREDQTALDGAFYAWNCPEGDDPEDGLYPLVFDCPDRLVFGELDLPIFASVQLAAFAHALERWPDVDAYESASAAEGDPERPRLASMAFIPAGLLQAAESEEGTPAEAFAIVSGVVRTAAERINPLTGVRFQWAEIETFGGTLDVVVDRQLLGGAPLEPGNVIVGTFWLSGQIGPEDEADRPRLLM
ncbi:MAG: hypothetical protein H6710_12820 [Myxococcales bacterium]|nr:hypothetical protein [Myxococcales bacterium]MCB9705297.1 hypothetical protein [Myxococcales bacterium]